MKAIYRVDGEIVSRAEFYDRYVEILENDSNFEEQCDSLLDEIYPVVEIMGVEFSPSVIVKEMDSSLYSMFITEEAERAAEENLGDIERKEKPFDFEDLSIEFVED